MNNGFLTVQAVDSTSGVAKIFVNSTEFTDLTDGTVSVQLQQFDSTYSTFMIQAMDNAGNMDFSHISDFGSGDMLRCMGGYVNSNLCFKDDTFIFARSI